MARSLIVSYDLRGQWSTYSGWTGRWHWVGPAGGFTGSGATYGGMRPGWQYCFEVRAHDRAGNISAWANALPGELDALFEREGAR